MRLARRLRRRVAEAPSLTAARRGGRARARIAPAAWWTAVVTLLGASLLAGEGNAPLKRPKYEGLRFDEDWSVLADAAPDQKDDPFDPIKHVPLTRDGLMWASFGGQVRERVEMWNDFGFGGPGSRDAAYLLSRFRAHADLHFGPHFRVFLEGKSAHSTDRDLPGGRRTLDVDVLDLQNGFIDVNFLPSEVTALTLRTGRQELALGKQRYVSPLDWANTRRTFEGVSAILTHHDTTVTAFCVRLVDVDKYHFNDDDDSTRLAGVYATTKIPSSPFTFDCYYLRLLRSAATFNGTTGQERRHTVGCRLGGPIPDTPLDFDVEGAWQFGEVGTADIDAFMVATELGCSFPDAALSPRVFAGLDYASGDHRAGGDVQTHNHLFPLGHAYHGYIDMVGRLNVCDLRGGFTAKPAPKISVKLEGHYFWRADDDDALYNAGGGVVRPGAAGSSSDVGAEVDFVATYQHDRHFSTLLGYSHFFPGSFIEQSGPHKSIDFAYCVFQYTF